MKNKLTIILVFLFFCMTNLSFAGSPVNTASQNISPLSDPIRTGEPVLFLSSVTRNDPSCNGAFIVEVDLGPYASQQFFSFNSGLTDNINMTLGPVTFNMPAVFFINQTILNAPCNIISGETITTEINILPEADIPTLSQWSLITVGFFLMIFGVVSLKRRATALEV